MTLPKIIPLPSAGTATRYADEFLSVLTRIANALEDIASVQKNGARR